MMQLNSKYFQTKLLFWHATINNRQLPWKEETNVYFIWLSEIILQQTRAAQGLKYYKRFTTAYPTIHDLAKTPLEEVYKLWEGLGYYNRCRNLHATAQKIVIEFNGEFPKTYQTIIDLKGVGPYTASAIASFAYNLPHAVVDGNVFRVLSRFFGIKEAIDSTKGKKLFEQIANDCLAKNASANYNQAIMDFGATICKPDNPLCTNCVMRRKCFAYQNELVKSLPFKEKKVKQRSRWFVYYILCKKGKFAVQERKEKDIWQHLYQFPLLEFTSEKEWKKFVIKNATTLQATDFLTKNYRMLGVTKNVSQKLSHQTIHAVAVLAILPSTKIKEPLHFEWKTPSQLKKLPFPRIIHLLFNKEVLEVFARVV